MNTQLTVRDTHPTKGFSSITQLGLKALGLAAAHKPIIDERLPGAVDDLTQDLDAFGAAIPGTVQKRNESVAATSAQKARLRQGYARARAIRRMVRKAKLPKEVQHAYGVGRYIAPTLLRHVAASIQQIVDRATLAPQEAAALGLGSAAVAELTSFLASLADTDKTQEKKRASAPLSTKERNTLGNRIQQTVALIAGAGMLAFADDPATYASFEALLANSKRTVRKTPKKKSAPPETPKPSESPAPKASSVAASAPAAAAEAPAASARAESA